MRARDKELRRDAVLVAREAKRVAAEAARLAHKGGQQTAAKEWREGGAAPPPARCASTKAVHNYRATQLARQGGRCGLCGTNYPGAQGWHLDHDHAVDARPSSSADPLSHRSVLCRTCNTMAVAAYESDPKRYAPLMRGVEVYIDHWKAVIQARKASSTATFADA